MTLARKKERRDARNSHRVVPANAGTHTHRNSDVEGVSNLRQQLAQQ
jgi:hypothetical protein